VRGATSRIRDYRRIEVHSQVDIAVTSRAVEPVVLAVAELLDNAARHSQPNTTVQVQLQPAHNGTAIVIDDAGVGLLDQEVQRAEQLLAGQQSVDIQRLGDPPQFGFPVIGILADRYGFRVSVDTVSPYGGVRAVVFLPSALLTRIKTDEPLPVPAPVPAPAPAPDRSLPQRRPAAAPAAPAPADLAPAADAAEPEMSSALGLPKRRRRQPIAERPAAEPTAEPAITQGRTPQEAAAVIGAFARGTRSGRSSADSSDHEGNSQA
jgi:hypothetical protein